MSTTTTTKVELKISCENLPYHSSAQVILLFKDPKTKCYKPTPYKTEVISYDLNPKFVTGIIVENHFEELLQFRLLRKLVWFHFFFSFSLSSFINSIPSMKFFMFLDSCALMLMIRVCRKSLGITIVIWGQLVLSNLFFFKKKKKNQTRNSVYDDNFNFVPSCCKKIRSKPNFGR